MIKAFLSHSSKQKPFIKEVASILGREKVILDEFVFESGRKLIDEINNNEEKDENENIYKAMESEFGRELSNMEVEIVKAWKEKGYSDEIITEALRESVMNGVAGLRYMDKILYEWSKKGIKTKEDVEKNKKEFREKVQKKKEKIDVFDYDWIDDDE